MVLTELSLSVINNGQPRSLRRRLGTIRQGGGGADVETVRLSRCSFFHITMRITGPLLLLRLYDSRATAVSPLSAFGLKGRLSVTSVLELGRDATP